MSAWCRATFGYIQCIIIIIITQVRLSGKVSSQYLTALLMAAPLCTDPEGVEIVIKDELVSQPYVSMTVKLMERFGVKVGGK